MTTIEVLPAVAEIKVVYRTRQKASERPQVCNANDANKILQPAFDPDTVALFESFVAMYLNRANRVLAVYRVSNGGITGTVADPRIILGVALKIAATSVVLAHNHPSGSLKPSRADEELTSKIREGARFMDLKVLDHLIVSPDGEQYFSFADEGLL